MNKDALRLTAGVAALGVATSVFGWLAGGMFIAAAGIPVALGGLVWMVCVIVGGALSHAHR